MKKIILNAFVLASLVITASCNNNETKPAEEKVDPAPVKTEATTVPVAKDTARTTIKIGKDGAEVSTKKGTTISVDPGGAKVGTKDVKVDIKTGN